jgi:hypothetical protein
MNQSRQFLNNGYYGYSARNERDIEKGLGDVERQIGQAASAANNSEEKRLQQALNQTSDSIQRLESMQRRLQSANQQNQNQQGQQNQRGQQQGNNRVNNRVNNKASNRVNSKANRGQQRSKQQGQQGQQGQPASKVNRARGQQGQQGQQGQGQRGQQGQGQGQQASQRVAAGSTVQRRLRWGNSALIPVGGIELRTAS